MEITVSETELAAPPITQLELEERVLGGSAEDILERVTEGALARDLDVLRLNTSEVLPALFEQAEQYNIEGFQLGRLPGYQRLT